MHACVILCQYLCSRLFLFLHRPTRPSNALICQATRRSGTMIKSSSHLPSRYIYRVQHAGQSAYVCMHAYIQLIKNGCIYICGHVCGRTYAHMYDVILYIYPFVRVLCTGKPNYSILHTTICRCIHVSGALYWIRLERK